MLSNQVCVKFLVAVLCISCSRFLPAESSARLDNEICPNYELDESAMKKYFESAMDYFKEEIKSTDAKDHQYIKFVNPVAHMKSSLMYQYIDSNCTDIDKKCDAIRLFSINFQNGLDNYPPMYKESIRIMIRNFTYSNCDSQHFEGLEAMSVRYNTFEEISSQIYPNRTLQVGSMSTLSNIKWSQFSNSCSNFNDIFTTEAGEEVHVPFTTLNGRFESGKLRDIEAEFITIPLGDSVNDVISIIIVIPSAPVEDIYDFGTNVFSHVDYNSFFNTIGVEVKAVALPPVEYYNIVNDLKEMQTKRSLSSNYIAISSNTTMDSCNGRYDQNSADIFKINRPFIIFATWKKTIIAAGIITRMDAH